MLNLSSPGPSNAIASRWVNGAAKGGGGFAAGPIMKSLLAALPIAGALALAPVAFADGSDDQFLSALAAAGIPAHDGIPAVIAHGHDVCDVLGAGMSPGEAADEL